MVAVHVKLSFMTAMTKIPITATVKVLNVNTLFAFSGLFCPLKIEALVLAPTANSIPTAKAMLIIGIDIFTAASAVLLTPLATNIPSTIV